MVPETEPVVETSAPVGSGDGVRSASAADALVRGTMDGMQLLINIVAMIVVLFALVSLFNQGLALLPVREPLSIQTLLGYVFRPLVWMMGISGDELNVAAKLLGTKVALNEFVSYTEMANLSERALGQRSRLIMSYAMCGFANFASVGLVIGAMGNLGAGKAPRSYRFGAKNTACWVIGDMHDRRTSRCF